MLVAQLDRVPDYESGGCEFDSCLARHFREIAQLGSAPDLGSGGRRFESCFPDHFENYPRISLILLIYGAVAHLGEHLICTQKVASSILVSSTINYIDSNESFLYIRNLKVVFYFNNLFFYL